MFDFTVGDKVARAGWAPTSYVTITAVGKKSFLGAHRESELQYSIEKQPVPWVRWVPPFPFQVGDWVQHANGDPMQIAEFRRAYGCWDFRAEGEDRFRWAVWDGTAKGWQKVDPPKTAKRFLVETEEKVPTLNDNFFSLACHGPAQNKIVFARDVHSLGSTVYTVPTTEDDAHNRGGLRDVIVKITELD